MYRLCKDSITGEATESAVLLSDGISFPFYDGNTDYQAYQAWLAEGNTPLPPEGI